MNESLVAGRCPHDNVLLVAGPVNTQVQLAFRFPCGCGGNGTGAIPQKAPESVASMFQRATKRVDWKLA